MKDRLTSLRDTFLQLPMPTRVIGGSMIAVIAIGLWMLASGTGRTASMERLFSSNSLTDDEINRVLAAFSAARLNGWNVEHNRIYVPSSARDEYFRAVSDADALPLGDGSMIEKAMSQASPLDSDSRRRSMENHGKERELGRQIRSYPEITRATVIYDSLKRGFAVDHRQSASVIVTPIGSDPLPAPMIRAIKETVRAAYAGMSLEDVTVTDVNARGTTVVNETDDLFQQRKKWEEYYTQKARILLSGYGALSIDATVDIDPSLGSEKAKLVYDQQPTTLQEQSASTNSEVNRPLPSGAPGANTNGVGNQSRAIDPAQQMQVSKTTQKNESTIKVPGEEFETSKSAGFQPQRVSFSIGIPESYYDQAWKIDFLKQNPDAKPEDFKAMDTDQRTKLKAATANDIRNAIKPILLEGPAGEDRFPLVEVWDHRDLPEVPYAAPSMSDKTISWLSKSWQTLAMLGLAIVALVMVRGMSKMGASSPMPDFEEGFGLELPKPPAEEMLAEEDSGPRLTITGQHLKQELTQLVGTNPEAAANVLRKWLDGAAA